MMRLTLEQVMGLHHMVAQQTGGCAALRDISLLESALAAPFQTFDGRELYATVEEKAARLAHSLIVNHAFADGNKRIGMLVLLVFLEINGISLVLQDADVVYAGLGVARGELGCEALYQWILAHRA